MEIGDQWVGVLSSRVLFVGLFAVTPEYKYPACLPSRRIIKQSFGVLSGDVVRLRLWFNRWFNLLLTGRGKHALINGNHSSWRETKIILVAII